MMCNYSIRRLTACAVAAIVIPMSSLAAEPAAKPVPIIFDTDMGNDIDDALALGLIHALQSKGECKLLAVTLTKDNRFFRPLLRYRQHLLPPWRRSHWSGPRWRYTARRPIHQGGRHRQGRRQAAVSARSGRWTQRARGHNAAAQGLGRPR